MKLCLFTLTLVLATLPLSSLVEAKSNAPASPQPNSKRAAAPAKPKSLPPGEVSTSPWTDAQVSAAKAKCTEMLSGVRLDFEPLTPIHQGLCGTPAPILVRSFGVDEKVELDPPATVSCELARALSVWVKDVQREAKELLGSAVVKLQASSFACRNIYNRKGPPLSQHALANALDLTGFVLASGEYITVQGNWRKRTTSSVKLANAGGSLPALLDSLEPKSEFVRNVHEKACGIFATVLGPRANKAHDDHFHLDMKQRLSGVCH
jgi:hypothetical protein